jgi:hypothetical protein
LSRVSAEAQSHLAEQLVFLPAAERFIVETAQREHEGDWVAPELAAEGALDGLLKRPWVYFRSLLVEAQRLDALGRAGWVSWKDGFVLCALEPPPSPEPDELRRAVQRYYLRGALFEDSTSHVARYADAHRELSVFTQSWADGARAADTTLWLRRLELEEGERASEGARPRIREASESGLLVVVLDELTPGRKAPEVGPALTGNQRESLLPAVEEEAHWARVIIHDTHAGRTLLTVRRHLDAKKLGLRAGASYTAALQGCSLAMEARASVGQAH